jgi:hypothetical protein
MEVPMNIIPKLGVAAFCSMLTVIPVFGIVLSAM